MPHQESKAPVALPLIYAAVFLGILLVHIRFWWPFYSDDALISLRYAARLLEGKGLNWNDAPPHVEGYSNLLWTLLVALIGLFRVDLILASRVLGVLCMALVPFAVARWQLSHACPRRSVISLGVGLLFFTLAAPVAIWGIGGLEQPLIAALLAFSMPLIFRLIESESPETKTVLQLSFLLGLLCITRPDGPIFSVAAFVALIIGRFAVHRSTPPTLHLIFYLPLFPLILFGGQLLFRVGYYGEWVPNTALVKIAPRGVHLRNGLEYVSSGFLSLMPFSALAGISLLAGLFTSARRGRTLTLLVMLMLWVPYIAFVGGDIHPAHRHFLPVIVVFTFALVDGVDQLMGWIELPSRTGGIPPLKRFARILVPVLLITACFPYLVIQSAHPDNLQVNEETWVWNGEVTGRLLKQAFGDEQPLVAVTAAGCIPYWSGLPSLDMLGLNDYYLPRHPPENIGEGYLGHELGDGRYVLDQHPDIICFHTGIRAPIFRSGAEMDRMEEFHRAYTPLRFEGRDPKSFTSTLFLRRDSRKVGIQKSDTLVRIPGYWFQAMDDPPAFLDEKDRLTQTIAPKAQREIEMENINPGDWTPEIVNSGEEGALALEWIPEGSSLRVGLRNDGDEVVHLIDVILRKRSRSPEAAEGL